MKPGQRVYTVTTTGIQPWYYVASEGRFTLLSGEYDAAIEYQSELAAGWQRQILPPRLQRGIFRQNTRMIAKTLRQAIQMRIEMLEKSIRTMQTTMRNHRNTIRQLKLELEE